MEKLAAMTIIGCPEDIKFALGQAESTPSYKALKEYVSVDLSLLVVCFIARTVLAESVN